MQTAKKEPDTTAEDAFSHVTPAMT